MSAIARRAVSTLALRVRCAALRLGNQVDVERIQEPSSVDIRRELRAIQRHTEELLEAGEALAQQLEAAPPDCCGRSYREHCDRPAHVGPCLTHRPVGSGLEGRAEREAVRRDAARAAGEVAS